MLKYLARLTALVLLSALVVLAAAPAGIASTTVCVQRLKSGICVHEVEIKPAPGQGGNGGGGARKCVDKATGETIPCQTHLGVWFAKDNCYVKRLEPQPSYTDPNWDYVWRSRTTGEIWICTAHSWDKDHSRWTWKWFPSPPIGPDPAELAMRALARLELRAVGIGLVPYPIEKAAQSMGLVGRSVWMWVENPTPSSWGPKSVTVTESGQQVSLSAKVTEVVWDMGDGTQVRCGLGTPWNPVAAKRNRPSPDCGHVYTKEGPYTVQATSHWVVTWSALGQSGQIDFALTDSVHVVIGELQVLNR